MRKLEVELADHKVFLDKVRRISLEEEKKRFRSGLVTSALENNVSVGQIGDTLVEILQKCLFDDDNEKKTLQSKLERVREMVRSHFMHSFCCGWSTRGRRLGSYTGHLRFRACAVAEPSNVATRPPS